MANNKITVPVVVDVDSRNAKKNLNEINTGLGTLSGQKILIQTGVSGGKELSELIAKIEGLKSGNKKLNLLDINEINKYFNNLDGRIKKATGRTKTSLVEQQNLIIAYKSQLENVARNIVNQRRHESALGSMQIRLGEYNRGHESKLQELDSVYKEAVRTQNYREQNKLLAQKRDLLMRIDKNNRNNANAAEIVQITEQISANREKLDQIKEQKKAAKEAERNLNIQNRLEKSFYRQSTLLGRLGGLASRYFSIYAVIRFAQKVAETTGYFQQQQIALEGIIGSASEAQKILDQIKSFALQSPFQTKELVGFTKQLSAYGIETEKLFPTVKQLADISAGLGVDMSRLILAYGQVKSASVLRGQELRQFTEAGVPMVDALAKKFTKLNGTLVTTGDIFKMISERKVPFEIVAEVLSDMTAEGGKFYKMQENLTNTLTGQMNKLRDMWTLAMNDMGNSVGKIIMSVVKALQTGVQHMAGILSGGAIAAVLMSLTNSVRTLKHEFNALTVAQKKAVGGLRGYLTMGLKAFGLNALFTAGAVAFGFLAGKIVEAIRRVGELGRKMNEAASSVMKDTNRMVRGLNDLTKKINEASVGTKKYKDAVSALAANYGDFLSEDFINKLNNTDETARQLAGSFRDVASAIQDVIRQQGMYKSIVAQSDVAADLAGNRTKANMLKRGALQRFGVNDETNKYNSYLLDYLSKNGLSSVAFQDSVIEIIASTITEQAKKGTAFEKLDEELSKAIKDMFLGLDDLAIDDIVSWAHYAGIDEESYNKAIERRNVANSSTYARINHPFEEAQDIISSGGRTGYEQYGNLGNDMRMRQAMREAMEVGGFSTYSGSRLESLLENSSRYDYGTASEILEAVVELRKTIDKDDHAQLGRLSQIEDYFKQGVSVRKNGDHAEAITNAFNPVKSGSVTITSDESNQIDLLEFFMTRLGITKEQASGLLGNLQQESGMKPSSKNSIGAEGLAQWLGPRKPKILEHINKTFNKEYASIIEASFEEQIEAVAWELEESEKRAFGLLKKATTAEEAADIVRKYYERPEPGSEEQRRKYARDYYNGILTGQNVNSSISNAKNLNSYANWFQDERLKPYALQYGSPTDMNINEKREALASEIASQEAKYKKEADSGDYSKEHKDREYIIQNLKKLYQDDRMYGGVFKEKGGKALSIVGELFSWIKDASKKEDQMLTLTGNTSMLSERAIATKSGPLHDFFAPGSVFGSFVSKLNELDLEDGKIFSAEDLKRFQSSNYRNADGTTNYQKASTDLLAFLKERGEALNNEALIELVRKMTAEMEKFFAQDAVKQQIDLALKELRGINDGLKTSENDRKNYETLLPQIGATAAAKAINNPSVTNAGYMKSSAAYNNLVGVANSNAARGLMTSDAGVELAMLLQGGAINISNLGKLFEIIQGLQESITDPENRKKFEAIMPTIIEAINKMIESLLDDEAKNAAAQSSYTKAGVAGTAAQSSLADRIARLSPTDTSGRIQAVQDYYKGISGDLYSDWSKVLYGDEKKGVSNTGRVLSNITGKTKIQDIYAQKKYASIGEGAGEKQYEMAAEAVANFAAKCEMASDIIGTVSQAIGGAGSIADSVFGLLDSTNGVHLEDGVYVQDNDYTADKQIVGTIMDFAEGMGSAAQSFMSGDYLGAIIQGITTLIDFFSNVFNSMDAVIQEQIAKLEVSNAKLGKKIEDLAETLKDAVGGEVWDLQKEQLKLQQEQIRNLQEMERLEASKKKGDASQSQAYRDEWKQLESDITETIRSIRQEVLGTADELSATLSDAFVEAFKNGQNAARAWRDSVLGYVGDILRNVIFEKGLAREVENVFEKTIGKSIDDIGFSEINSMFSNASQTRQFVDSLKGIYQSAEQIREELPQYVWDVMTYNPSTQNLGSGIQSITEDTGRTLEALQVSMLTQVVQMNVALGNIDGTIEAQMGILNTQLQHMKRIDLNVAAIRMAVDSSFSPGDRGFRIKMN